MVIEEYARHVAKSFSVAFVAVMVVHLCFFAIVCCFSLKSSVMLERFLLMRFSFSESLKKRA
jgi:hypothetical protein